MVFTGSGDCRQPSESIKNPERFPIWSGGRRLHLILSNCLRVMLIEFTDGQGNKEDSEGRVLRDVIILSHFFALKMNSTHLMIYVEVNSNESFWISFMHPRKLH